MNLRHSLNLLTGVSGCIYCIGLWSVCGKFLLTFASYLILFTTILFHGGHVIGNGDFADSTIMPFDFSAVVFAGSCVIVESGFRMEILFYLMVVLFLWIISFNSFFLKLPLNVTQSIIHIMGVLINANVFNDICQHF